MLYIYAWLWKLIDAKLTDDSIVKVVYLSIRVFCYLQIYGSVTMSNILSLSVFLGLVYVRELTWSFSSEVLVILIVCILMGVFASFRTTFPLWTCLLAFSLYPLSILLVYVLEYVVALS